MADIEACISIACDILKQDETPLRDELISLREGASWCAALKDDVSEASNGNTDRCMDMSFAITSLIRRARQSDDPLVWQYFEPATRELEHLQRMAGATRNMIAMIYGMTKGEKTIRSSDIRQEIRAALLAAKCEAKDFRRYM